MFKSLADYYVCFLPANLTIYQIWYKEKREKDSYNAVGNIEKHQSYDTRNPYLVFIANKNLVFIANENLVFVTNENLVSVWEHKTNP